MVFARSLGLLPCLMNAGEVDDAGLLQHVKFKQHRKLSGTDERVCTSYGDPHIYSFDGARWNCFAPGDFYFLKSDKLDVQVRYMGPDSGPVVGATSLYGVTISGDMVGGVIHVPSLTSPGDDHVFKLWAKDFSKHQDLHHNIYKFCPGAANSSHPIHRGSYFFPSDNPCEYVDLDAQETNYETWKGWCEGNHTGNADNETECSLDRGEICCYQHNGGCINDLRRKNADETEVMNKCGNVGFFNNAWKHTSSFDKFTFFRGPGPHPGRFNMLTNCTPSNEARWAECGRTHLTSYSFTFNSGVKIVIAQGHRQGISITVPDRTELGSGDISGHCGNWDDNKTNDYIESLNTLSCPDRLFSAPEQEHESIQNLDDYVPDATSSPNLAAMQTEAPLMMLLAGKNEQEWKIGKANQCRYGKDDNTNMSYYICNRFFADQPEELDNCIIDCCEERSQCPDRDNGDAVKVCLAHGDPHIKTFDSMSPRRSVYFNHGDYHLHKSDILTVDARYGRVSFPGPNQKKPKHWMKASITRLAVTGPLVGPAYPNGSYPVIEIPTMQFERDVCHPTMVFEGDTKICTNLTGQCGDETPCHFDQPDGFFNASFGYGFHVTKYFDQDCAVQGQEDVISASVGILEQSSGMDANGTSGWTVCKQTFDKTGAVGTRQNKKLVRHSLTIDFWAGGLDEKPLATLVVNNGRDSQQVMLSVNTVMVDPTFAGAIIGHCGNADGVVDASERTRGNQRHTALRGDLIDPEAVVPPALSLFSEPHPSLNYNEDLLTDAGIDLEEFTQIMLEVRDQPFELDPAEYHDYALFYSRDADNTSSLSIPQQYLEHKFEERFIRDCMLNDTSSDAVICGAEFVKAQYQAYKYQVACQLEYPGLPPSDERTYANVIEDCVTDCQAAGRCPAEDDEESWSPPQQQCPHPNTEGAFQACNFWGEPHFQSHFIPNRTVNYSQYLHSRGKGRGHLPEISLEQQGFKAYSNHNLGLQRLFRTKATYDGPAVEAQGFFCDGGSNTSSAAGVALRIGARTVTLMRPWFTSIQPNGTVIHQAHSSPKLKQKPWTGSFGLDLALDGEHIEWSRLGNNTDGMAINVSEASQVSEQLQYYGWWAQQMRLPDTPTDIANMNQIGIDLSNSVKPMCIGDQHRKVMVKASVPRSRIYEPVVTIELDKEIVDALEDQGLCMGEAAASLSPDLDYADSIFSVAELYNMCSVCGMMGANGAGTNNADLTGWETSSTANGCFHPNTTVKSVTGAEICAARGNVAEASLNCEAAGITNTTGLHGWFDSCLAEMCNAPTDSTGVHFESDADNAIEILASAMGEANQLLGAVAAEYGL